MHIYGTFCQITKYLFIGPSKTNKGTKPSITCHNIDCKFGYDFAAFVSINDFEYTSTDYYLVPNAQLRLEKQEPGVL